MHVTKLAISFINLLSNYDGFLEYYIKAVIVSYAYSGNYTCVYSWLIDGPFIWPIEKRDSWRLINKEWCNLISTTGNKLIRLHDWVRLLEEEMKDLGD